MWQQAKNIYHWCIAFAANIYYGFPTKKITVIGVTGTDGKTTTVNMIYHVLTAAGKKASMVSTINAVIAGKPYDTGFHVSSPDPFTVQKFAKEAVVHGDEYLVLEVTSHALDQHRFGGVDFTVGVVTNITHDHLDYHKTWENYFTTKAKLLKKVKAAVINRDEKHFDRLSKSTSGKIMSFGFSSKAMYNPKTFPLKLKMLGDYNTLNALAAAAVCTYLELSATTIKKALGTFSNLKGRMEEVKNTRGVRIVVDFASTPHGFEQALQTLRKATKGRLIAVFGSAGKRDIAKRTLMGKIAATQADIAIITAEDPRGEWEAISKEMLAAAVRAGGIVDKTVFVMYRREKAVDFAINTVAKKGDIIGFFGKGHETSNNYDGRKEEPYSEFEAIKKALKKNNIV